jgi:two-component system phosphate regulon sensor histidine kinase PhoR
VPGEIVVYVALDLPNVRADAERLEDVLANLISNACKFSEPGSPVHVDVRREGEEAIFSVRDRGIGIPPEEVHRIFDRFYQVQRGADRRAGGSGLGLYIVRGYVTAMGGRIWVESTPGQGSTFFVGLPLAGDTMPEAQDGDGQFAGVARGR